MGTSKNPEVARWFASTKHAGQPYGTQPYTYHLESAVQQLHEHVLGLDVLRFYDHDVIICATWLHDVVEDTDTPGSELRRLFCNPVVDLVEAVTDGPGKNRRERKAGVYKAIREVGPAALAVKLADRLANSLACGLSKDPTSVLDMYRKEQPGFERELRFDVDEKSGYLQLYSLRGFGPAFTQIRKNLGME